MGIHLTLKLTITSVHSYDAENGCLLCVISDCLNQSTFIVRLRAYTLEASRHKHRDHCFSCYMKPDSSIPCFLCLPLMTTVIRASVEGYHTYSQIVGSMFSLCVQETLWSENDQPMFRSLPTQSAVNRCDPRPPLDWPLAARLFLFWGRILHSNPKIWWYTTFVTCGRKASIILRFFPNPKVDKLTDSLAFPRHRRRRKST